MAKRLKLNGQHRALYQAQERAFATAPRRRATRPVRARHDAGEAEPQASSTEAVNQALHGILHTATDLLGAQRGFLLICNDAGMLEVACARSMRPADVVDLVLTQAAIVVGTVLRERQPVAADALGRAFQVEGDAPDSRQAAIFCMPLDLGDRRSGLLCALRDENRAAVIGALDLEILHGLCDQAALVIGASTACTALAQLAACLQNNPPGPPQRSS